MPRACKAARRCATSCSTRPTAPRTPTLTAAQSAFAQAHTATLASARGTAFEADVQALLALRNHQFAAQQQVQAPGAKRCGPGSGLAEHTRNPAWRALRRPCCSSWRPPARPPPPPMPPPRRRPSACNCWPPALALVAAVAALALTGVMLRTLRRELGGDLAQARSALRRVAEGDLHAGRSRPGRAGRAGADGRPGAHAGQLAPNWWRRCAMLRWHRPRLRRDRPGQPGPCRPAPKARPAPWRKPPPPWKS